MEAVSFHLFPFMTYTANKIFSHERQLCIYLLFLLVYYNE